METSLRAPTSCSKSLDSKELADLIQRVREEEKGISNAYRLLLSEISLRKLIETQIEIIGSAETAGFAPQEVGADLKDYIVCSAVEAQLGIVASSDTLRNFHVQEDGRLEFLEDKINSWPFLHSRRRPASPLEDNPTNIPPQLRQDLHTYTQLVLYAVQEKPMIVALATIRELILKEMDKRDTLPPSRERRGNTNPSLIQRQLEATAQHILLFYDIITVSAEEFVLQQIGYDTARYAPEGLDSNPNLHFCRSLGAGLFNLVPDWLGFLEKIYSNTTIQQTVRSFRNMRMTKASTF